LESGRLIQNDVKQQVGRGWFEIILRKAQIMVR
jgi:hypothetical protein